MIAVVVKDELEAIALKEQILATGLEIHKDFTWEYQSNIIFSRHYDGYDDTGQPEVLFTFVDPVQETFFRIQFK